MIVSPQVAPHPLWHCSKGRVLKVRRGACYDEWSSNSVSCLTRPRRLARPRTSPFPILIPIHTHSKHTGSVHRTAILPLYQNLQLLCVSSRELAQSIYAETLTIGH